MTACLVDLYQIIREAQVAKGCYLKKILDEFTRNGAKVNRVPIAYDGRDGSNCLVRNNVINSKSHDRAKHRGTV